MESQESESEFSLNAGNDPNPATESLDLAEVARADVRPSGAAAASNPPQIPLAPMKRVQARFNPLADGLMYLVVFVGGFVGVGCRRGLDMLLPSVNGTPFVVGTFVSNMLACFLFAMLTEYMATASWLRRRVRQAVSRGVGLGFLGGLSTMSGVMLETMEGLREHHVSSAFGYLAGSFVGGIVAALAGVAVMQFALARGARKRLRGTLLVSDSGESDTYGAESMAWMSVSPESDTLGTEMSDGGVKHAKVADVAHSAAQAAQLQSLASQESPIVASLEAQTTDVHVPTVVAEDTSAQSVAQSITQPITQSIIQPGIRPIAQSSAQPITQSSAQSDIQPSTQPDVQQYVSADLPSFEPKPVTAEIPMVPDPTTGEVR